MSDNLLNRINIFSDLSEKDCENLQSLCKPRNYLKNSMIILEEEYGDLVFVVKTLIEPSILGARRHSFHIVVS